MLRQICNQLAFGMLAQVCGRACLVVRQIQFHRLAARGSSKHWPPARTRGEHPRARFSLFSLLRMRLLGPPNERAAGDLYDEVLSSVTVHPFSQTIRTILGDQARLVILRNEIVGIVIGFENDIATAPAIAATGAAFGPVFFPLKGNAAFAAVARSRVNFYLVNEHGKEW